jgi:hypothetical protein
MNSEIKNDDADAADTDDVPETLDATISALNSLSILSRLQFVANLLFDNGGSRHSDPKDWNVVLATEVLGDVIRVINTHPKVAELRRPKP